MHIINYMNQATLTEGDFWISHMILHNSCVSGKHSAPTSVFTSMDFLLLQYSAVENAGTVKYTTQNQHSNLSENE